MTDTTDTMTTTERKPDQCAHALARLHTRARMVTIDLQCALAAGFTRELIALAAEELYARPGRLRRAVVRETVVKHMRAFRAAGRVAYRPTPIPTWPRKPEATRG